MGPEYLLIELGQWTWIQEGQSDPLKEGKADPLLRVRGFFRELLHPYISVADPDPGSCAFLTLDPDPGSEIGCFPDPGSQPHIF